MLNIQKTSSLFKPELNRDKSTVVSQNSLGHPRRTKCNICKMAFKPRNRHELFCEQCRLTSETYRFAEWLAA
jgi:protein-arginine kinase activator protein McsA